MLWVCERRDFMSPIALFPAASAGGSVGCCLRALDQHGVRSHLEWARFPVTTLQGRFHTLVIGRANRQRKQLVGGATLATHLPDATAREGPVWQDVVSLEKSGVIASEGAGLLGQVVEGDLCLFIIPRRRREALVIQEQLQRLIID